MAKPVAKLPARGIGYDQRTTPKQLKTLPDPTPHQWPSGTFNAVVAGSSPARLTIIFNKIDAIVVLFLV